jgi:hypothetical protein
MHVLYIYFSRNVIFEDFMIIWSKGKIGKLKLVIMDVNYSRISFVLRSLMYNK